MIIATRSDLPSELLAGLFKARADCYPPLIINKSILNRRIVNGHQPRQAVSITVKHIQIRSSVVWSPLVDPWTPHRQFIILTGRSFSIYPTPTPRSRSRSLLNCTRSLPAFVTSVTASQRQQYRSVQNLIQRSEASSNLRVWSPQAGVWLHPIWGVVVVVAVARNKQHRIRWNPHQLVSAEGMGRKCFLAKWSILLH